MPDFTVVLLLAVKLPTKSNDYDGLYQEHVKIFRFVVNNISHYKIESYSKKSV